MDIEAALDAAEAADAPTEAPEPEPTEAEPVADSEAEVDETEAEAEAEPEPEPAPPAWDDDLPAEAFSAEALSKPEGVQAAAKLVEEKRVTLFRKARELDGRDIRHKQKVQKWEQTRAEHLQEQENFRVFARDVHTTVQMLRNGNAAQRLDALGRLTGQDPRKAYEELSYGVLRDGKPQKKTPEYEALESQVAELKQLLTQRDEQERQRQAEFERREQEAFVQRRRQEIGQLAADAARFPAVAHYAGLGRANEIVEYAVQLKREHEKRTGEALDDAATLGLIERELAPTLGERVASQPTSSGPPQKPSARAQRSPGQRSVTPSVASQSAGSTRVLTDDERYDELARDPDFLASLGFG